MRKYITKYAMVTLSGNNIKTAVNTNMVTHFYELERHSLVYIQGNDDPLRVNETFDELLNLLAIA